MRKPGQADRARRRERRGAFTLIELMIVVAIIGVLAGLLLPVLSAARAAARQTACSSNLRQLGLAVEGYKNEYDGYFPPTMTVDNNMRWHGARASVSDPWDHTLGPLYRFLKDGEIHACPAFTGLGAPTPGAYELGAGGYGYNEQYIGGTPTWDWKKMYSPANEARVRNQPETLLFGDAAALDGTTKQLVEYSFIEAPLYEAWGTKSDPSCHFRHNGRANFAFCDGHVAPLDMDVRLEVSGWTSVTVLDCIKNNLGFPPGGNDLFDRQ